MLALLQTINKLLPLFQKFSLKQQLDVIVVDLKSDVLSCFSAEVNVSAVDMFMQLCVKSVNTF